MNIIKALHSEEAFLPMFKDIATWQSWEVYLRALFGLPINEKKDQKLFRACTGLRKSEAVKQFRESFVVCGRRSGKSFISAIIAVYIAVFKDWSQFLSPGERGHIFVIANDRLQARIVKNYVSGILKSSSTFRGLISKDSTWEVALSNQVSIMVKTASFRTLRGFTLLACIMEEISFWRSEESANPDREILTAVRPSLATIPESLLIGISTPYSRAGVLFEMFKKYYGVAGGPLIWRAPTRLMNPTIDASIISKAIRDDPSAGRAEWEAEFRLDIEAFMPVEFIEAVVVPGRFELPKIEGVEYFGFTDPSGGRQDSFTLGISHRDSDGRIVLDLLKERRPPFQPSSVAEEFSGILKAYGISEVSSDRYAAEWVTEAYRKHGITVKNSELSASEIYLSFLPLVANGSIELLDSKRLRAQLAGLERRTRIGGKDSITHFPGGHDDVANSCAGSCLLCVSEADVGPSWVHHVGMPSPALDETKKLFDDKDESESWLVDTDFAEAVRQDDVKSKIITAVEKQAKQMYENYGYASPFRIARDVGISFDAAKDYLIELKWVENKKNQFVPRAEFDKI